MTAALQLVDPATGEIAPDVFDDFWLLYPRRVAKKDARRAWARIPRAQHVAILTALAAWRRVWLARGELEFVPHPATWLNGERWDDELPAVIASNHASHQPAALPAAGERSEMPAHVRALLAKLRGGR